MRTVGVLLCLAAASIGLGQVTSKSILKETVDLTTLTRRPNPYYTTAQASSYDRASVKPGVESWFANGDAGQYVREESREGRTERVMADLKGPGAVVRIWSANPAGTLRFYFDGEETPRFVARTIDLLGGKVAPFAYPYAYEASRGWNFYYPLPYAQSLKITVDDTDNNASRSMYYQVGYRTYEAGTQVETFQPGSVDTDQIASAGKLLTNPYTPPYVPEFKAVQLRSRGSASITLPPGPKAVSYLVFRLRKPPVPAGAAFEHPGQVWNQFRQIIFEAEFDGQVCIRVPIGDFFGAAPGPTPYVTYPIQVDKDGSLSCRFVMPYEKTGIFRFRNTGGSRAEISVATEVFPYEWTADSYHFMAQWTGEHGRTRPMRDMSFLNTTGEGIFVGDNMHISNPTPAWWGEGDEKIYVDGQTFPSTFGTGTEDYYGYAWCYNQPFARPFHAQPKVEAPGNFGQTVNARFHILDPIPFKQSFKFDMEMWHWADVMATYVHTAYWYAKPGRTTPVEIDPKLLTIYEMRPPDPVKGAIEGEDLKMLSMSGGEKEIQEGFWETSGGKQLWWRNGKPGDKLEFTFPVAKAGKYKLSGHFCFARDYGIHRISVNGGPAKEIDFYSKDLGWKMVDLGTFDLPGGEVKMTVEVAGTNDAANPKAYMFGLDYLKLGR